MTLPVAASTPQLGGSGAFRVAFEARELFNEKQAEEYGEYFNLDQTITWQVFVPEAYDPAKPAGVLTYVSPTRSGLIPENWKALLTERNLIWVGANRSGNGAGRLNRSIYAILGTELIRTAYQVDEERFYISGFSGGGRVASILMHRWSHLYKGAVYLCGVNFWEELPRHQKEAMISRRHVFLTGTKDFNYRDTTEVLKHYRSAGMRDFKLMVIPDMGHRLPDPPDMAIALDFLDQR